MQRITVSWLVYRLTNSMLLLGVVSFMGQLPVFLMTPFSGVLVDRYNNRHKVIIVMQCLAMTQAFIFAALVLTGTIRTYHIVMLSFILGVINSIEMPARQSFIVELIDDRKTLSSAIALNSSMVNVARLVGPSLAGAIIAIWGEGLCFVFNGLSYLAVLISLLQMKFKPKTHVKKHAHVLQDLKEGVAYVYGNKPILFIISMLAFTSLVSTSYQTLLPVFARDIFHGGSHTAGFMSGALGCGALIGAGYLGHRKKSISGLGNVIASASLLMSLSLIAYSISHIFLFSIGLLILIGLSSLLQMASSNTLIQTLADDSKRGRVMSIFIMAWMGMTPFGALLAGVLARHVGAPHTLLISGSLCLIVSIIFLKEMPNINKAMS